MISYTSRRLFFYFIHFICNFINFPPIIFDFIIFRKSGYCIFTAEKQTINFYPVFPFSKRSVHKTQSSIPFINANRYFPHESHTSINSNQNSNKLRREVTAYEAVNHRRCLITPSRSGLQWPHFLKTSSSGVWHPGRTNDGERPSFGDRLLSLIEPLNRSYNLYDDADESPSIVKRHVY